MPYVNKHAKGGVLEHLGVVVQRLAVAVLIIFVHLQKGSLQKRNQRSDERSKPE